MSTNFSPTSAELTLVNQIFLKADPTRAGFLTGDSAVKIFGGAKLPPTTLGEIWSIADSEDKGQLSKKGVAIALRLIGWAQRGEKVSPALLNRPGPLPIIEGVNSISRQNTGASLSTSPPPLAFPPLEAHDRAKFHALFAKAGPENGLLSGEKARDIFLRSKLPNDNLSKIWNLADTKDRGALDVVDFSIGMYFIQAAMSGKLPLIPTSLPPGLYQQAGGTLASHFTGNSGSFSPLGPMFPQHTGPQLVQSHTTGPFKPPLPARPAVSHFSNGHGSEWDITPTEKASSDRFFDTLDTQKRGYIEGEIAVPFMLGSKLPEEVLAQIWDLADIHNNGMLTRDGFAIAMHLIQKKLAGQQIPSTLPPSLIPPSLRPQTTGAPFAQTSQPQPVEIHQDLLGWDDTPVAAPASSILKPQITGPALTTATSSVMASPPQPHAPARDPFASSPFGQHAQSPDLLSEDAYEMAPSLQDHSAEIGNLKNQIQSTTKSLSSAQSERAALEEAVNNQAAQLSSMQTQLSSAKAAYETESKLLESLKERRAKQISEIQSAREELIRAESDLSAIRVEKSEIEGAFLRDKEEARDLHRRMIEAGQQADAIKIETEKLRKEAKQQKGLLAIARKQLITKENERAKAEKEHEEASEELASISQEKDAVEAEITSLTSKTIERAKSPADSLVFAAAQPLPATPDPSIMKSPSIKSNNPFAAMATTSSPPNLFSSSHHNLDEADADDFFFTAPVAEKVTAAANPLDSAADFKVAPAADSELSYFDEPAVPTADDQPASPYTANDTEHFVTPPTSAVHQPGSPSLTDPTERFPSLDDVTASIATIDKTKPASTPPVESSVRPETDINTQLRELDVDESDSSDEESSIEELEGAPTQPPQKASLEAPKSVEQPKESLTTDFDDVFGSDQPAPPLTNKDANAPFEFTPFGPAKTNGNTKPDTPVAGVDVFDSTLTNAITNGTNAPAPTVSFDAMFEDSFDFAAANKALGAEGTSSNVAKESAPPTTFDDVFLPQPASSPPPANVAVVTTPSPPTVTATGFEASFDAVFAPLDKPSTPVPQTQPHDKATATPVPPSMSTQSEGPSVPGAFPGTSTPSSPKTSTSVSSPRNNGQANKATPFPPARSQSPAPRATSPKPHPRLSSSSSKETPPEKPKEAPRHSKISLRLPFGKKKKQQPEPLPSSHLTPPPELPRRTTPASDDDVEAVKQLVSMGFSRSQAVEALEKYGYDVPRALNNLLGAP